MECDESPFETPSVNYKTENTDMEIDGQEYLNNSNPEIRVKKNGSTSQSENNNLSIGKLVKANTESQVKESKALSLALHLTPKTAEKVIATSERLEDKDLHMIMDMEELSQEQQNSLIAEAINNKEPDKRGKGHLDN
jgi:hypothetical protein